MKSKVNFVLHAHLPFVRHIEYDKFLEENWLFESINETYIPLLKTLENLSDVKFTISMCFSPTLCAMLCDEMLQERFIKYMEERIELGVKEVLRCKNEKLDSLDMAIRYLNSNRDNLAYYIECKRALLYKFKQLQINGKVHLLATAATNVYLPVYKKYESVIHAQIKIGIDEHIRYFEKKPDGFLLPENGYFPGLEDYFDEYGIKWISLSSSAIALGKNKVESAGLMPTLLGESNVLGLSRNWAVTNKIWSDKTGYPCDKEYRDFYSDIGYDLDLEYIRPYIHEPSVRVFTSYKYNAIGTGREKKLYDYNKAMEKVALNASNFIYNIKRFTKSHTKEDCLVNLFLDAELFGHRWYEGIEFLNQFIKNADLNDVELISASEYIKEKENVEYERAFLNESSSGYGGFSDTWISNSNDWVYRHTFKAIERMEFIANRQGFETGLKKRYYNQVARELLLALSSDWTCILHNQTSMNYAHDRIVHHIAAVDLVFNSACKNDLDMQWLSYSEKKYNIFPNMDYNIFYNKDRTSSN